MRTRGRGGRLKQQSGRKRRSARPARSTSPSQSVHNQSRRRQVPPAFLMEPHTYEADAETCSFLDARPLSRWNQEVARSPIVVQAQLMRGPRRTAAPDN
jgi:hypothetical protein